MGITQGYSGVLGHIEGFNQLIPGSYKSDKPVNIIVIDEIHLKCDCMSGSTLNGIRQPILFTFALDKPPGHKRYKEPRDKLLKKINKSVLSHITFFLEDKWS